MAGAYIHTESAEPNTPRKTCEPPQTANPAYFSRVQSLIEITRPRRTVAAVESDKTAKLSFEAALAKLETIVESMEQGEVPLADLLAKYEEGTKLLKVCEGRLKDAELKIEKLKSAKDGAATFENFESTRAE